MARIYKHLQFWLWPSPEAWHPSSSSQSPLPPSSVSPLPSSSQVSIWPSFGNASCVSYRKMRRKWQTLSSRSVWVTSLIDHTGLFGIPPKGSKTDQIIGVEHRTTHCCTDLLIHNRWVFRFPKGALGFLVCSAFFFVLPIAVTYQSR